MPNIVFLPPLSSIFSPAPFLLVPFYNPTPTEPTEVETKDIAGRLLQINLHLGQVRGGPCRTTSNIWKGAASLVNDEQLAILQMKSNLV